MFVKQFLVFAFVLPITISCSKSGGIEQRIGDRVNACKPTEACIIKIKELTDFQWDKMYVFTSGARNEHIDKALGIKYPDLIEFTRLMVFTKDGKIVHREEQPTDNKVKTPKVRKYRFLIAIRLSSFMVCLYFCDI